MLMRTFLAALAVTALTSCASSGESASGPALFVARDADSTLYIYGTIHLRKSGAPWASPAVDAAIASADEIWTEIEISPASDARTQQLALQAGLAPAGRPLSSWLSAEENERLRIAAQQVGLQAQALEPMQPWLASLTLTVMPMVRAGYDPNSGVDRSVDSFGDANGKTMRHFETPEEQIGFFANMSPELQRQLLLEAIDEVERGVASLDELSASWEAGDLRAIERLAVDEFKDEYPEVYAVMLVNRNRAWADVLSREMEGAGVDFVAVGAAHLVGNEGLIELLRARGMRVERVRAQ